MKRSGGSIKKRLEEVLKVNNVTAEVGLLESARYPDGEYVAQVGFWNEYGHEGVIPARTHTIYKEVNLDTMEYRKRGRFVKADKANFAETVTIPSYTLKVESRPFFRNAIASNRKKLPELAAELMEKHDDGEKVIKLLCEHMVDELKKSVIEFDDPENKKSTVRKKGFNNPLIHTRQMLRSFDYEVTKK